MDSSENASGDVEGFSFPSGEDDTKAQKKAQKGTGFERLGLSFEVLKGIKKKGYKVPTPIQRKTIPLVMSGRDVVAMARTGSGKTACFLVPLFERLKVRTAKVGARALILSPTRELAVQTLKFIRELGKFTGLKAIVILGGDSMDNQFSALHGNPDIVVATPGRFLHLCVEMDMKLDSVEYVVFDEADRLFEMGFGEQMNEILARLPEARQTLLFSATLPKLLVDFARAGLTEPILLRLDVESKLPELLKLVFLNCRAEDKDAALLVLLKQTIGKAQSAIFVATKHHVEYLSMLLDKAGISNTCVYSNLDPSARKINVAKFEKKKAQALIVTDVAARGIDLPFLDNVINYNFPAKAKLFVHRVGRCARAGRSGTAFSLVSTEELPYFLDLHLFLAKRINIAKQTVVVKKEKREKKDGEEEEEEEDEFEDGVFGNLPQVLLDEQQSFINVQLLTYNDLDKQKMYSERGYKRYVQTRPAASTESIRRLKDYDFLNSVGPHPLFDKYRAVPMEKDTAAILSQMKEYRPKGNILELGRISSSANFQAMREKRSCHQTTIQKFHQKIADRAKNAIAAPAPADISLPGTTEDEIDEAFKTIIKGSKRRIFDAESVRKKKMRRVEKDEEHYIPYASADKYTEEGLTVNFEKEANSASLDLLGDTDEMMRNKSQQMKWDRKKKKMVQINPDKKVTMVRTESGQKIPATYKSGRYKKWVEKNKIEEQMEDASEEEEEDLDRKLRPITQHPPTHWGRHNAKLERQKRDVLLKPKEHILKKRLKKDKEKERIGRKREMELAKKKNMKIQKYGKGAAGGAKRGKRGKRVSTA